MAASSRLQTVRVSRDAVLDQALALALLAYAELEIWAPEAAVGVDSVTGGRWILAVTAAGVTLPLAGRRRFPLGSLAVVALATAAQGVFATPTQGLAEVLAVMVAAYTVAAWAPLRRALAGAAALLLALVPQTADAADFAFAALILGAAWVVGLLVHRRQRQASALSERAERLEAERDESARVAVAEERARIARELHDVVAHGVSTIVVQAQAGEAFLGTDTERAAASFGAIERTGREALVDLRRLLGLLRDGPDDHPLAPQPGLGRLDELVEGIRAAGLIVETRVEGTPRPLPPGVDLAGYRILQEALTNALKHAAATRVDVLVRYGRDELQLEVADDGTGGDSPNGGGHGLVGMRERVALYGGRLEAGPSRGGGYRVRAALGTGRDS